MDYCLWCHEIIVIEQLWGTFFHGKTNTRLCKECSGQIETIKGNKCKKCFRPFENVVCPDCVRWKSFYSGNDPLTKNISLYTYNDLMKAVIAKWKYRGDYTLGEIFYGEIKRSINRHFRSILKEAYIVPIPLSDRRQYERAFNQSNQIALMMTNNKRKIKNVLYRTDSEKQSKKTRVQRLFAKNPFKLRTNIKKTVILVDDIYTTGTTIRHAAELLLASGCPSVYSFTLIRG